MAKRRTWKLLFQFLKLGFFIEVQAKENHNLVFSISLAVV